MATLIRRKYGPEVSLVPVRRAYERNGVAITCWPGERSANAPSCIGEMSWGSAATM